MEACFNILYKTVQHRGVWKVEDEQLFKKILNRSRPNIYCFPHVVWYIMRLNQAICSAILLRHLASNNNRWELERNWLQRRQWGSGWCSNVTSRVLSPTLSSERYRQEVKQWPSLARVPTKTSQKCSSFSKAYPSQAGFHSISSQPSSVERHAESATLQAGRYTRIFGSNGTCWFWHSKCTNGLTFQTPSGKLPACSSTVKLGLYNSSCSSVQTMMTPCRGPLSHPSQESDTVY